MCESTAADRAAADVRRLGREALLREKRLSPRPPLPKSGWRLRGLLLRRWFRLRGVAIPCCLRESTAADRAAADLRRWGTGGASPPDPLSRRAAGV